MLRIKMWFLLMVFIVVLFLQPYETFAEMRLTFGGEEGQPISFPYTFGITKLNTKGNGSNSPLARTDGRLPDVKGKIRVNVKAASPGDWSVNEETIIMIHKPLDEGFVRTGGLVVKGMHGALIVLAIDLSLTELSGSAVIRIKEITTTTKVSPRYIANGLSDDVLPARKIHPVNTDLTTDAPCRIGFANGPYVVKSILFEVHYPSLTGTRPNLVLFLGDDQSIFDHSAYGNPIVPTNTTEQFAKESLVFDKAFTTQTLCAPSRSSLYTGRYPIKNGCFLNHKSVRPDIKTLPSYLRELGYRVILAGKSHVSPRSQFPWTFHFRPEPSDKPRKSIPLSRISQVFANQGKNPFVLIIASEYPHSPYHETSPYDPQDILLPPFLEDMDREEYALYYRNIIEKEEEFAQVLKAIDDNQLKDNTVVIYADDHGHQGGKYWTYDRGMNVAFMVRWPSMINPGRTDKLISFNDFVPTLIDLAGGTVPDDLDGQSMLPIWENPSRATHDCVYGVAHKQGTLWLRGVYPQRSVHDGRFHYVFNFNSRERLQRVGVSNFFYWRGAQLGAFREEELFDTLNDPYEFRNLASDPSLAETKARLKKKLFEWMLSQGDFLEEDAPTPFLSVDDIYRLDIEDPERAYFLPDEHVGSLEGLYVDGQAISGPNRNASSLAP